MGWDAAFFIYGNDQLVWNLVSEWVSKTNSQLQSEIKTDNDLKRKRERESRGQWAMGRLVPHVILMKLPSTYLPDPSRLPICPRPRPPHRPYPHTTYPLFTLFPISFSLFPNRTIKLLISDICLLFPNKETFSYVPSFQSPIPQFLHYNYSTKIAKFSPNTNIQYGLCNKITHLYNLFNIYGVNHIFID